MQTPRVGAALLALLVAGGAVAASPPEHPRAPRIPGTWLIAAGPSSHDLHLLMGWTSPRGIGLYVRGFPTLDDNHPAAAWTTITDEYAGEAGVTQRVSRALTVGLGWGRYERTVTTYGAPTWLFGIPATLDEAAEVHTGPSALAIFNLTTGTPSLAACLCLSPAGSGVAFGLSF